MDYKSLIDYLKQSCFIDDPNMVADSMFLALTDEELTSMLEVAYSKVKTSLSHLTESGEMLYALVLLAKQDVYARLSLKYAIQYDIGGEDGSVDKSQRFEHFSRLLELAKEEWNEYVQEQQAQVDVSNSSSYSNLANGEIFIDRHYFSSRNVMYHNKPVIVGNTDKFTTNTIDVSWKIKKINHFKETTIYLSESPVYDKYENTVTGKVVFNTNDLHRDCYRIKDLKPNTTYYVAFVVTELNGLQGVYELIVTTESDV